jgi:hypothetical protein
LRGASAGGVLLALARGIARRSTRRTLRRQRRRLPRLRLLVFGLAIMLLSITTCSAGVDLASLTAEYGPAVPANRDAARRFVERVATAVRTAPASRQLRIEITDVEATSALSLGLMMPELMQAMETMTAEEVQRFDDLAELREHLRARTTTRDDNATVFRRIGAILDPRIRSGDVQVRFTAGGEIVMAGYIQAWRWQQPALVVFAPRARSGELELDFRRGRLGRVPAPERAFDRLAGLATSVILQGREYAEITELTVEDGRLTFVGVLKHRP